VSTTIGRVVVGVDGSPGSLQALRFAVCEARAAEAVLVPVIAWLPPGGDISNRSYPLALARELRTEAEHELLTAFDEALGGVPIDLRVEPQVVRGRASRVLVAVADRADDVLITGRGHGIVRRALYGSVARYCLSHAYCPVVAVPPPAIARGLWRTRWGLRLRGVPGELVEGQRTDQGRSDAGHDTFAP
jgi:nucleotide-binding universal stress UspA family protein